MTTEKRLIYANVLLSAIDEYMGNVYGCPLNEVAEFQSASNDTKVVYAVEGLYEATEIIDEQPTVDAAEVVHAEWLDIRFDSMWKSMLATCSHCKVRGEVRVKANECGFAVPDSDYCPHCGAKMDGGINK